MMRRLPPPLPLPDAVARRFHGAAMPLSADDAADARPVFAFSAGIMLYHSPNTRVSG